MDLRQYLFIARRWAWLGILGLILGGVAGYFWSIYQTPVYRATTRMLVIRAPQEKVSDYTYLTDQQLTQTYIELATTEPVLDAVAETLGYSIDRDQLTVQQIQNTQVIKLSVEDPNPIHAAAIANTLVEQLIKQNEIIQAGRFASADANLEQQIKQMEDQISGLETIISQVSSQSLQQQMAELEAQIKPLQEEKARLQQEIAILQPAYTTEQKTAVAEKEARIAQIEPLLSLYQEIYSNLVVLGRPLDTTGADSIRLAQLQNTLKLYQDIYINLLSSRESVRLARLQNTPNIVQIEPATTPVTPVRPLPLQNTLLGGTVGFMLAFGIAFLVEYLDNTLKTVDDVERVLQLPVIGYIAEISDGAATRESLYVMRQPRSPISEAFRLLRTNIEFSGVDHPVRRLMVTSTGPGEGKTTVAVNLAAIIAQGGKRVVILDADMRRPKVHRFLGILNQYGLSDLFRGAPNIRAVAQRVSDLENVIAITSGSLPPNPAELLGSVRMEQILQEVERESDVVVIDSPPSLVADVQVLAAKVDGVIIVVQPGHTQTDAALATLEQLKRAGARILGVVLNRIPHHRTDYYGGYRHYSPYYSGYHYYYYAGGDERNGKSKMGRLLHVIFPNHNGHKKNKEQAPIEKTMGQSR